MSQSDRNRFLAGTYGSSLSSLTELGAAMQSGNYRIEGSEIIYGGGKRMSLAAAKSHMENVENIGTIALNDTNQVFREMRSAEKRAAENMKRISQV